MMTVITVCSVHMQ